MANQMKRSFQLISVVVILVTTTVFVQSCNTEPEAISVSCSGTSITYTEANTLIQSYCSTKSGCHGTNSHEGPGELLTYAQIYAARASVKSSIQNQTMPEGMAMSTDDRATVICWIENGAANN